MTANKIEAAQKKAQIPYEVAKQIRQMLDEAKKAYGVSDWNDEMIEEEIQRLVFED